MAAACNDAPTFRQESGLWLSLGGFQEEASPGVSSSCVPPPPVALPAARCEAAVYEAAVLVGGSRAKADRCRT